MHARARDGQRHAAAEPIIQTSAADVRRLNRLYQL
jgi:hypothetical protein